MSLPCRLYPGYLLIYGAPSITGITVNNRQECQFGTVNQIYDNLPNTVSVGQSVMFELTNSIAVQYSGTQYFLIEEAKVILIETPLS